MKHHVTFSSNFGMVLLPSLANRDSHDYFSQGLKFIIRMPSNLHEAFCARVVRNICNQLDNIAALDGSPAAYARNVEPGGSPTLKFPSDKAAEDRDNNGDGKEVGKYDTHDPDATFYYSDMYWPCVLIEVSYPQKRKALKDLAEDYICRNYDTKQWNPLEKSGICTANFGGDVPEVSMHFHQFRYSSPQYLNIVTRSCT